MLSIREIDKKFHANTADERHALNKLSLELQTGDFCIVIGSNGAGKSSLLNAIAGKLSIDSGGIFINEQEVSRFPVHKRARWVSRVFQDPMMGSAPGMTVEENLLLAETRNTARRLRFGLNAKRRDRYRDYLAVLGLGLEDRLQAAVDLLSGGQRQSLSLIMAVINEPSLLLLDEHTAALDPRTAELVMSATINAVNEFKLTTLMVTHNMQHAISYGSRLLMMESGKIRLMLTEAEKKDLQVEDLVERFHLTDDKILLSEA